MVNIKVTASGFFADKPIIKEHTFSDETKTVDKTNKTMYLREMHPEEIENWFVENYILGTALQDRLISIHVKKT